MHALIVVAHPDPRSKTLGIAMQIAEGIIASEQGHSFEVADLAAEGFDPRFTSSDIAAHLRTSTPPDDVVAEQDRIDRADALVLVYPVYWWSMPALLKGWIDRVFANGWAYEEGSGLRLKKNLHRLPVHLIAIGGASERTYARHGYFGAMKTQIDHGIFDYCGAPVKTSELLLDSETPDLKSLMHAARSIGAKVFPVSEQKVA